jgi:hypothetical protein
MATLHFFDKDHNMYIWSCFHLVLKTYVEQTKGNYGSYFYLYPFVDLAQGNF